MIKASPIKGSAAAVAEQPEDVDESGLGETPMLESILLFDTSTLAASGGVPEGSAGNGTAAATAGIGAGSGRGGGGGGKGRPPIKPKFEPLSSRRRFLHS